MKFLFIVFSYLLGSIPFGYLIFYFTEGRDIRTLGSGNIGATNVLRSKGKLAGLLTLALDILKGAVPVIYGRIHFDLPWIVLLGALAVLLGHVFPVFLKFRGGKGVASLVGIFLVFYYPGPAGFFSCFFAYPEIDPLCFAGFPAGNDRVVFLHPVHPGGGNGHGGFRHAAADRLPAPLQYPTSVGGQ